MLKLIVHESAEGTAPVIDVWFKLFDYRRCVTFLGWGQVFIFLEELEPEWLDEQKITVKVV